jgi:hypothetical protein
MLNAEPAMHHRILRNQIILRTLVSTILVTLIILLVLQLRKLLYSLKQKPFLLKENFATIKTISYILISWIFVDFILYQSLQFFIPLRYVQDSINYIPVNKGFFLSLLFSVNFSLLLTAFSFYVISVVFKEGVELKKEAELTI